MTDLWHDLGINAVGALAVVVSSMVMYAVFAAVLHRWGERLRSTSSVFTTAVAALIGSIAARATLGNHPTLAGGLIALATLLVLERFFGALMAAARPLREHRHARTGAPPMR